MHTKEESYIFAGVMMNFKKVSKRKKIIPQVFVTILFYYITIIYAYPDLINTNNSEKNTLRVPVGDYSRLKEELSAYNARLAKRDLRRYETEEYDVPRLQNKPKFFLNGQAKPFYGLTCVAWVKQGSQLYERLCDLQDRLKKALEAEGLSDVFSFLDKPSFHMTICDIDPSDKYNRNNEPYVPVSREQFEERLGQIKESFSLIDVTGQISARIHGLGLKSTITALAKFPDTEELIKVRAIEDIIKRKIGGSVREFTGHISLAYLVSYPGHKKFKKAVEILSKFENVDLGDFVFDSFDFAYFQDMNHFIPLVTKDLVRGEDKVHDENIKTVLVEVDNLTLNKEQVSGILKDLRKGRNEI